MSHGKIRIRRARLSDLDDLVGLEAKGFSSDQFGVNQFKYLVTKARATVLVGEAAGRIAGAAVMLWRLDSPSGRLYNIVIDPLFQGRGIGSRLLEACEKEAAKRRCETVRLEVRTDNRRAIDFYRHHGYVIEKTLRGYYSDGASALRMKKRLDSAGLRKLRLKIPYYGQTLGFTCGPACMMMAFKYLDCTVKLNRTLEMTLWKEATLIYMTSGMGGCGPYGMALAARRRGFAAKVVLSMDQTPFFSSVRSESKRKTIRLVHEDMKAKCISLGVRTEVYDFTMHDIAREMSVGYVPIVLVSTYHLHGDRAPHWVILTGYDSENVYFHDSFEGFYEHDVRLARNISIPLHEFESMRRYGKDLYKCAVFIGRRDIKPKIAMDGGEI